MSSPATRNSASAFDGSRAWPHRSGIPHVVTVFRAGEDDGRLYIAMDFVEGADLNTLLDERGAPDPAVAAGIVAQVASALDAAHAKGWCTVTSSRRTCCSPAKEPDSMPTSPTSG